VTASYHIQHGDCLESLQALPDESVDSVVTDPPYGLSEHKPEDIVKALTAWLAGEQYQPRAKGGFMGRSWDRFVPGPEVWRECLRVLKPGGHLLCFAGTRTVDLMGIAVRLAGFEIRDEIQWLYGTGFPKSLDISKAIDGLIYTGRSDSLALREVNHTRPGEATVRKQTTNGHSGFVGSESKGPTLKRDTPASAEATQWAGWHTALKPAHEPIIVARKPLDGTVAENVLRHGTGGVNVDGCRIESEKPTGWGGKAAGGATWNETNSGLCKDGEARLKDGRFPANIVHDGSDEVKRLFPTGGGGDKRGKCEGARPAGFGNVGSEKGTSKPCGQTYDDSGNTSRFFKACPFDEADDFLAGFYCAKAPKSERLEEGHIRHTTVKPVTLMRWLCRLVTPPDGMVLDPFCGSGSTGVAAVREGFSFLGMEQDEKYVALAEARLAKASITQLPNEESAEDTEAEVPT